MKFSELEIYDEFKFLNEPYECFKATNSRFLDKETLESYLIKDINIEVEKISTKSCETCKHFEKHTPELLRDNYCVELGVEVDGNNDNDLSLGKDPKTFFCSAYERKEN